MKRFPHVLAALLIALATMPAALAEPIARTLQVGSAPDIHIINAVGEIEVRGKDSDRIEVEATLGDSAERLDISERGDRVTIEVIYKQRNWRDDGTRLTVSVPAGASIEVDATSADVDIAGVRGRMNLSSVSGDVDAEVFGGNFEARSTSGDVRISGHLQVTEAAVESTSGDVVVSALAGSLRARSTSGDVEVADSRLQRMTLSVVSGDIEVDDATLAEADIDIEAVSGDIELRLPRDFSGRVAVSTLNGAIDNCFGPKPQRTSRYGPGYQLSFDQGTGAGRVDIDTVNGDIELCKK